MTRALFRKQMMEVFSWIYKDRKSGKLRKAKGIAGYVVLYLILFGFIGAIFGIAAAALCRPLLSVGMGWLYWCLMGLIAVFFGVFGSVFNTYSSLYRARDNDLLLSMPVPTSRILMVRLSGMYAMGLMYEMITMIPTMIIWFVTAPFSVTGTINVLLIPVVLSFFILVLSAVIGWIVAQIVGRIKHRNMIIVFISLIFMAAYYYIYSKAYSIFKLILMNADAAGTRLRIPLYPLYHMGMAAQGRMLSMLIFTAIVAVLSAATYAVLLKSFLRLATSNPGAAKTVYKEQTVKAGSVSRALLHKEFKRFTGGANYMLNCGLGIVMMPVSAVVLFVLLMAETGLMLDLKMPNLHWSSEVVPIKQSAAVTIALFGGWGIVVVIAGMYVLAAMALGTAMIAGICFIMICVLLAAVCIILLRWLMCKGAYIFESLK